MDPGFPPQVLYQEAEFSSIDWRIQLHGSTHTSFRETYQRECLNGFRKSLVTVPTLADGINRKSEFVVVTVYTTICVAAKCPDLLGIELFGIQ